MKTTLREVLHAMNVLDYEMDITVDGIDCIAVVPPVMFTQEGLKRWEKALNAETDDGVVSDKDESVDQEAWDMLASIAGYCPSDDFDKWFDGGDARMI